MSEGEQKRFPWRTLLLVSVAVNLLVIGAVAGALGSGARLQRQQSPEAVVMRMPGARAFIESLPEDMRAPMRRELAESWRESRDARRVAAQARREAFARVAQEPYDAESVRGAFARVREADQAAVGVFHDRVINALGELAPEDRARAIEALRRAAPARRLGAAPATAEGANALDGGATAGEDGALAPMEPALSPDERREKMRERILERREERLRQRQEQQTP